MTLSRRILLATPAGGAIALAANAALAAAKQTSDARGIIPALIADSRADQSAVLQKAIDDAAGRGTAVELPPGTFVVSDIRLSPSTRLLAPARLTTLVFGGGAAFITAEQGDDIRIEGLHFDGRFQAFDTARGDALLSFANCKSVVIADCEIMGSTGIGLSLVSCGGEVRASIIKNCLDAALKSLDASGLRISENTIENCSNNGILVWRSTQGRDATQVHANRISLIRNASGGTGEYGNAVNVFRAGDVQVIGNTIADCSYSAVRGNAASNILIHANTCRTIGEVALYAEFGFEGAVITNNIVDGAACGISVTNFNEGGRLAVISGNLIRNLKRREWERDDKRGEGIGVEADATVIGNTIENAPTVGIQIGWGRYMRDIAVTGNVVRQSKVGIAITASAGTGHCLIANNMIAAASDGAVRAMHLGVAVGPDLIESAEAPKHITVTGNVAV